MTFFVCIHRRFGVSDQLGGDALRSVGSSEVVGKGRWLERVVPNRPSEETFRIHYALDIEIPVLPHDSTARSEGAK